MRIDYIKSKPFIIVNIFFSIFLALACNHNPHENQDTYIQIKKNALAEKPIPVGAIRFNYVRHIYLSVRLNDSIDAFFIFDTGARGIRVDNRILEKNNIKTYDGTETLYNDKVYQPGAGGGFMLVRFAKNLKLSLDTLDFQFDLAPVLPLDSVLGPALGHKFDGIIGFDLLQNFITEINYESKYILLHHPESIDSTFFLGYTKMSYQEGLDIKVYLSDSISLFGQFKVDIGKGGALSINTATVDHFNLDNILNPLVLHSSNRNVGGEVKEYFYRANSIQIDTFILVDPIVSLSQNKKGATSGYSDSTFKVGGIVGNEIFEKFNLIFDFKNKELYLKPNKNYSKSFGFTVTGFFVEDRRSDLNGYIVSHIISGSPAMTSGLKIGDIITYIDGMDTKSISYRDINSIIQSFDNQEVSLTITRGSAELKFRIKKRKIL